MIFSKLKFQIYHHSNFLFEAIHQRHQTFRGPVFSHISIFPERHLHCCSDRFHCHESRPYKNYLRKRHRQQILVSLFHASSHYSNLPSTLHQIESNIGHTHEFRLQRKSLNISLHSHKNKYPTHSFSHFLLNLHNNRCCYRQSLSFRLVIFISVAQQVLILHYQQYLTL